MRKLGVSLVVGMAMLGGAAQAQSEPGITFIETFAASYVLPTSRPIDPSVGSPPGGQADFLGSGFGNRSFPDAANGFTAPQGRALWDSQSTNNMADGLITFDSSNAVGGNLIGLRSVSGVQLGIENGGGLLLDSAITPAGFGFYVANAGDGSCIQTGSCRIVDPLSSYDFADFIPDGGGLFATVNFDFQVIASADGFDPITLYSASSSLTLSSRGVDLVIGEDLTDGYAKLASFGLDTPPGGGPGNIPYHSLGYSWQATPFTTAVGLLPAGFQTVTYVTTVNSISTAGCLTGRGGVDAGVTACLIAYSAFGDPIGQDVVENAVGDVGIFNHSEFDITGLTFTPFNLNTPRIEGGRLVVDMAEQAAVPEPATWALMIMGFGAVGGLVRRRQGLARA